MRCVDVIRELAVPGDGLDSAGLAEHLAQCPRCASWAERDSRLSRLWEATRPPELTDRAWERIWAKVSESVDRPWVPAAVPISPAPARPWRRVAMSAFCLAQAAAILVGFVWAWSQRGSEHAAAEGLTLAGVVPGQTFETIKIEQGPVPLIKLDGPAPAVQMIVQNENSNSVDPFTKFYNEVEGNATLQ